MRTERTCLGRLIVWGSGAVCSPVILVNSNGWCNRGLIWGASISSYVSNCNVRTVWDSWTDAMVYSRRGHDQCSSTRQFGERLTVDAKGIPAKHGPLSKSHERKSSDLCQLGVLSKGPFLHLVTPRRATPFSFKLWNLDS